MKTLICPLCGVKQNNEVEKCSSCGAVFKNTIDEFFLRSNYPQEAELWWQEPKGFKDPSSRYKKNWIYALLLPPVYFWYMVQSKSNIGFDTMTTLYLTLAICFIVLSLLVIFDKTNSNIICLTATEIISIHATRYGQWEKWNYSNISECLIMKVKDKFILKVVKIDGAFNIIGIPPKLEPIDLISILSSHGIACKDYTQQSAGPA